MTARPRRRSGARRVTAAALMSLAAAAVLAGCNDDEPDHGSGVHVVDGHYCGYLSADLVEAYLGHDDVTVRGDMIVDRDQRRSTVLSCSVNDSESRVNISVRVDEDHGVPPRDPAPLASGCTTPDLPTGWGPAQLCRTDYIHLTAWAPTAGRYLTADVDFQDGAGDKAGGDKAGDKAAETAVAIIEDVNATLDRYDEKHAADGTQDG